jgi:hypothetical protein
MVGRVRGGLAFLRASYDPSLGAFQQWHFCKMIMAPNKTGGGDTTMALLRLQDGPLEGASFLAFLRCAGDPL